MWKNRESLKTVIHHKGQEVLMFEILTSGNPNELWSSPASLLYLLCNGRWNEHGFMSFSQTFVTILDQNKPYSGLNHFGLRCGQGVGPPWPTEPLPPGVVYRAEIWLDHPRETVPLLMRGGGRFSKATHASLEVLMSSVGLWLHSQWFRPYLGLSFSSEAPEGNEWRWNGFYF